ncbi:hypothetical protein VNO77_22110 [Canavalia gladiata]|uniref:Uncharacterized protein n=1 Tax=Canavalia gladiata TaxID=3824 RepID=A0AAN9L3E8_CANGL
MIGSGSQRGQLMEFLGSWGGGGGGREARDRNLNNHSPCSQSSTKQHVNELEFCIGEPGWQKTKHEILFFLHL